MCEGRIVVYRANLDLLVYVVGASEQNELMLASVLDTFCDALWLEDGQWYEADESGGIRPLRKSLHKDEPFHPFFMDAHAAAIAWGWFRDLPPALHEAAFKIATLPVGSEVDRASAAFFTGDSEKHRRAEQLLASLGLNIDLFP